MILDQRTLNRALLERQLLLRRHRLPVLDAVRHLVGLQAQAPTPPYFGLWSRLEGFVPDQLSQLLVARDAVRAPAMRATIHLLAAEDAPPLRRLLQPVFDRALVNPDRAGPLAGIDLPALAGAAGRLLAEQPRTSKALGAQLAEHWPDRPPAALAYGAQQLLALVQVPPRGLWGAAGSPAWTTVDTWLGTPPDPPALAAAKLLRRYLAAFGPATVTDAQHWSGLPGLAEVVEPDLRRYWDERGRVLFDLPEATLPDPDTPAPARFVAPFDNLVIGHADRTRVISDEHRRRVFTINGIVKGTVLVDGFVAGCWRLDQTRTATTLAVEPFARLARADRAAVAAEADRLLEFAAPAGAARQLRYP